MCDASDGQDKESGSERTGLEERERSYKFSPKATALEKRETGCHWGSGAQGNNPGSSSLLSPMLDRPIGMSSPSDRELIAAAATGQTAAFASLLGRYRDAKTRFAIRMLGGYDTADEALQAAFIRAFQSISRCKAPDQFENWLFRIVINECRARALRSAVNRRTSGEFDAIADWRAAVEGSDQGADVQRAGSVHAVRRRVLAGDPEAARSSWSLVWRRTGETTDMRSLALAG